MSSYYKCKRCEFTSKQKNVMKKHLEKNKKCIIKNPENKLLDIQLYNLSLEKHNDNKLLLNEKKENFCSKCNKQFSNKFTYTRHIKNIFFHNYEKNELDILLNKKENNKNLLLNKIKENNKNLLSNKIKEENICIRCNKQFKTKYSYLTHSKKSKCSKNYEKSELYCFKNPFDFIKNIKNNTCKDEKCNKIPIYNYEKEKKGLYCNIHKLYNMIDVISKTCIKEGCKKIPNYNNENEKKGLYCNEHKIDGMIDIKNKKCIYIGCKKQPYYNNENEKKGLYCNEHKIDGMIDVKNKKCIHIGCKIQPSYNKEGEKKGLYCSDHKTDGMVDVKSKKCKTYLCSTLVNKKYDGYCLYCFINTFPDKPVSRNYKTKEYSVVEFVKNKFHEYSWISDKTIKDGCSRRRPDLLLDLGYQVIIIEIDENQHIDYDCTCENKRIMELSQDVGHRPIVFIRFNPDDYINNDVNITSCWGQNNKGICVVKKSKEKEWIERLQTLENQINYWTDPDNKTDKTVEIIQLYYDAGKPAGCPAPHPCRETQVSPTTPSRWIYSSLIEVV